MIEKKTDNSPTTRQTESFKKLSIQVSLNGLSFYVWDAITGQPLLIDEIAFKTTASPHNLLKSLKTLFTKHNALAVAYEKVTVVHQNDMFALVPSSLFEPNELANYLKFNTKLLADDHIVHDSLENQDIKVVYVPFTNINNYIFEHFGAFEFKHQSTLIVQTVFNQKNAEKSCYAHVDKETFELAVVEGKELLLYNQFTFSTEEDFLYYVLFTYEQLGLDLEQCKLLLFGAIDEEHSIFKLCYTYIRNVVVFEPAGPTTILLNNGEDSIDFSLENS